ncbi:MAG: hypothetical protein ACUVS3_15410, partial [Thermodesulfobacteriota bacterium]
SFYLKSSLRCPECVCPGTDLSLYVDFRARSGLNRKDARRFLEKEFSKEPKIRRILKRDPPCFGACHAALLACGRA